MVLDSVVKVALQSAADCARVFLAKKFRHGDVLDQKLCKLMETGFHCIRNDLEALNRRDLVASLEFFQEGITSACHDHGISDDDDFDILDAPPVRRQRIDGLYSVTKERFQKARESATGVLGNARLHVKDRIFATYIKVVSTVLGEDDPARAIRFCKKNLKDLHSHEDIQANFQNELFPRSPLRRESAERKQIILSVCHVNRVAFDMGQKIGGDKVFKELFVWPCIELQGAPTGKIDPLRFYRLRENEFLKGKMCHSVIECHSGLSEQTSHKINCPRSIAVTARGQYLVVDNSEIKLFDNSGNYQRSLLSMRDNEVNSYAIDLDTDKRGNIYLLVQKIFMDNNESCYEVLMFNNNYSLDRNIQLRSKYKQYKGHKLAVSSEGDSKTKVLVLKKFKEEGELHRHAKIEVYETVDCTFVSHFGGNVLMDAQDLVCDEDGHTFVLDTCHCGSEKKPHILEFDPEGNPHRNFQVDINADTIAALTFHQASKHIVFASIESKNKVQLSWYTTDGKKAHSDELKVSETDKEMISNLSITAATNARIVVASQGKFIVY